MPKLPGACFALFFRQPNGQWDVDFGVRPSGGPTSPEIPQIQISDWPSKEELSKARKIWGNLRPLARRTPW